MARKGKKIEKLVAFLESIEINKKAIITSPDFLIDKDSGVKNLR